MNWMLVISAVIGYALGNISTGIIIGKLYGQMDIRKTGSGNAGTTNVMRTLGWVPSILTLIGDALKAFIAVKVGKALAGDIGGYVGGVAVMCGHMWPAVFQFKGGKGMACALGIILANEPWLALTVLVIQIVICGLTRYMSVASLVTSVLYPVIVAICHPDNAPYIISAVIMAMLTIFCHRANIKRLIHHEENRLDFEKISKIGKKLKDKAGRK